MKNVQLKAFALIALGSLSGLAVCAGLSPITTEAQAQEALIQFSKARKKIAEPEDGVSVFWKVLGGNIIGIAGGAFVYKGVEKAVVAYLRPTDSNDRVGHKNSLAQGGIAGLVTGAVSGIAATAVVGNAEGIGALAMGACVMALSRNPFIASAAIISSAIGFGIKTDREHFDAVKAHDEAVELLCYARKNASADVQEYINSRKISPELWKECCALEQCNGIKIK